MGAYQKYILPRLIDCAMRNKQMVRLRQQCVSAARGKVLEIGIGSGMNLPYYSSEVEHIYGVDPFMQQKMIAGRSLATSAVPVDLFEQSAEDYLPVEYASIDTIVVTWSLCSIPDPSRALARARPLLKRTGQLIFIEHGLAPNDKVAAWQQKLNPVWKKIAGGCDLARKIDKLIESAGFEILKLNTCFLEGPRPLTYTYHGVAVPSNLHRVIDDSVA
ncbi:MAG: class I SAM-dependent methyltransferase [Acidobacteria bacterium]|nr:class I SAM-dependent methyltransferase [Acidobacteriota bacterium]